MNLQENPFIGQYTNEELQEWVKALQQQVENQVYLNEIMQRISKSSDRIIEIGDKRIEELEEALRLRAEQIKLLWGRIHQLESALIQPATLVASFSDN